MYDRLIEALEHCLRPKQNSGADRKKDKSYTDGENTELDDADIPVITECIRPYYKKGRRHAIVFGLAGLPHKSGISVGCFMRKPMTIDYLLKRIRSELD
ncbi:MAG TPA: hypothetical protein VEH06_07935 [Candidatus Bathyarchaeia archaeon]|nr:hypothetical protein [Candidatus Bathyarchaeia archaeon]